MQEFNRVSGPAAAFTAPNVDTDVIMPKQFLKGVDRTGLAEGVFYHLRFDLSGRARPDFVLNQEPWTSARFLVVGPNFGCGSSREHAVWGLLQLGIRALIGTTFAGIFNDNCQRNGLLTISLSAGDVAQLAERACSALDCHFEVDLLGQTIACAGFTQSFEIGARQKDAMLRGLDAVGLTLEDADSIRNFEKAHFAASPWLEPSGISTPMETN